jgi:hypothetical protein
VAQFDFPEYPIKAITVAATPIATPGRAHCISKTEETITHMNAETARNPVGSGSV